MTPPDKITVMLKPCPFCGGEAHLHEWPDLFTLTDKVYDLTSYHVSCTQCESGHPPSDSSAEAIAAWNARELKDMLEALQAEKAALEKWHEVAAVELNDAHARIWQLEAELAGARKRDAEIYSLLRRIRTWGITSSGYDGSECIENTADVDAMMRRLNEAKRAADAIEQGAHHADH